MRAALLIPLALACLLFGVAPASTAASHERDTVAADRSSAEKRLRVRVRGTLGVGRTSTVTLRVLDADSRPVRRARVTVTGVATARSQLTSRRGLVTFRLRPSGPGRVFFRIFKRGYQTVGESLRVR